MRPFLRTWNHSISLSRNSIDFSGHRQPGVERLAARPLRHPAGDHDVLRAPALHHDAESVAGRVLQLVVAFDCSNLHEPVIGMAWTSAHPLPTMARRGATGGEANTRTAPTGPSTSLPDHRRGRAGALRAQAPPATRSSRSGLTASSSPPEVCASASRIRSVAGHAVVECGRAAPPPRGCARCRPAPVLRPPSGARARVRAHCPSRVRRRGCCSGRMLPRWPRRPKPVTSVAARTPAGAGRAGGAGVEGAHRRAIAAARSDSVRRSRLSAVVRSPVPSGLVRTR